MALLNLRQVVYKSHLFVIRHAPSEHVEKWEFTYYKWITNPIYLSFDMTLRNMSNSRRTTLHLQFTIHNLQLTIYHSPIYHL